MRPKVCPYAFRKTNNISINFTLKQIKEDIVIVHYISLDRDSGTSAVRTSIWIKVDCDWKMYFHQGTPTEINTLL